MKSATSTPLSALATCNKRSNCSGSFISCTTPGSGIHGADVSGSDSSGSVGCGSIGAAIVARGDARADGLAGGWRQMAFGEAVRGGSGVAARKAGWVMVGDVGADDGCGEVRWSGIYVSEMVRWKCWRCDSMGDEISLSTGWHICVVCGEQIRHRDLRDFIGVENCELR